MSVLESGPGMAGIGRRASQELFEAEYDALLRYAIRRVGASEAEDVVADVFVVVCRREHEIPLQGQRAWLFGVAGNVVRNHQRSGNRRERLQAKVASTEVDPTPFDSSDDAYQTVHAALRTLRDPEQEALRLVEWDGLDPAVAANVCGCSYGAFRVRLHRARRHFVAAYTEMNRIHDPDAANSIGERT